MNILYVVYIDFEHQKSGSSVRPTKMYNAFIERNHNVCLIQGRRNRINKKNRKSQIKKIIKYIDSNDIDFCYIESPTSPLLFIDDIFLLRKLKKHKIPVGYFFRDMHYKFKKEFPTVNKSLFDVLKNLVKKRLYIINEYLIGRYSNIVYFPSNLFQSYFKYTNMSVLPPAGDYLPLNDKHYMGKTCIYVGGISERYGTDLLFNSFKLLNKNEILFKLILVCRKEELDNYISDYHDEEWLEVHHVSGKDLIPLYSNADLALIPLKNTKYNNAAVAVKLFEYMSFCLPIISTNCTEMEKIITKYDIGKITNFNHLEYSEAIKNVLGDTISYNKYRENMKKALLTENLWIHRVEKIEKNLLGIKGDLNNE